MINVRTDIQNAQAPLVDFVDAVNASQAKLEHTLTLLWQCGNPLRHLREFYLAPSLDHKRLKRKLSDAGGPAHPNPPLRWPARIRSALWLSTGADLKDSFHIFNLLLSLFVTWVQFESPADTFQSVPISLL